MGIFRKPGDYAAFTQLLVDAKQHAKVELFGFCLMPNHWHLVLRPESDRDLPSFMSWLTNTHVKRYRSHYKKTSGHLYQGRYKSFPVEADEYVLTLLRYVEANPLRAKLVARAGEWKWSSLGCERKLARQLLDEWHVEKPRDWSALVDEALPPAALSRIRTSLGRGQPLGSDSWVQTVAKQLGLAYTVNPRGRPKNRVLSE